MMKIYRIEHTNLKIGPLCEEGCRIHGKDWFMIAHDHPDFFDYQLENLSENYISTEYYHKFGCTSFAKILFLFKEGMLEMLKQYNFHVYEFEVKDYYEFDGQVMFDSRTALRGKIVI